MPVPSSHAGRRDLLAGLVGAFAVRASAQAHGTDDPAVQDIRRYVYVPSATTPDVTVIDTDTDRIVGALHTGIVARQAVVSRDTATLIATDGQSATASLVNVFTGAARTVALPAQASRLTIGGSGRVVAAIEPRSGTIALIEIGDDYRADTVSTIDGPANLRDAMFGDEDATLYVAAEGLAGVGAIDVATGRVTHQIALLHPSPNGVSALARTPDGRRILAQPRGGGAIGVLDPVAGRAIDEIASGPGAAGMYPSGTGSLLLVPDTARSSLDVFRSTDWREPVLLPGAASVVGVYTAWLDSVAFAPSAGRRGVLVYDLDRMRLADEIALPGTPIRGAVTPDSRALYLPLLDPPVVVAIEGKTGRVAATIDLFGPPLAALIAGGWGLCH